MVLTHGLVSRLTSTAALGSLGCDSGLQLVELSYLYYYFLDDYVTLVRCLQRASLYIVCTEPV